MGCYLNSLNIQWVVVFSSAPEIGWFGSVLLGLDERDAPRVWQSGCSQNWGVGRALQTTCLCAGDILSAFYQSFCTTWPGFVNGIVRVQVETPKG